MAMAPMILMAVSAAVSVIGQQQAAKAEQAQAEFQAKQYEQKAGQDRAMAQRRAQEERRQGQLAISRAQAIAGGGGLDDSVLDITGDIAAEGEYNALGAIYEGEQSALGSEMQAKGLRMQGKAARRAANFKSASTILSTASSMYGAYSGGGSPSVSDGGYSIGQGSAYGGNRRGL
jgi:hypothetical protein